MARITIARGARACEQRLLADLDALCAATLGDPRLLGEPIRVVVPSRSLREHLSACIVAHSRRAVAGVAVHTLYGFARSVLDNAGEPSPTGAPLFPLLVRQMARDEQALAALDALTDGYASLVATIADVIDAGFEPAHAEPIQELLEQLQLPAPLRERVRAVIRVAERSLHALYAHGVARQSAVFTLARAVVARDRRAIRARAIVIYGFADATGVAADFIDSLLHTDDARVYLDHPHDLAAADANIPGAAFVQRFAERVLGVGAVERRDDPPQPPVFRLLRVRGAEGEARAVAERIRSLLDNGVSPEDIGVVARNLGPYCVPLRLHFGRLGIPFSALDVVGPFDAARRQMSALLDVMQQRESAPAERWINALAAVPPDTSAWPTWRADIRLALHTLGAARIGDVAALADETGSPQLPLPFSADAANTSAAPRFGRAAQTARARRVLARAAIAELAAALVETWNDWPPRAAFDRHAERFMKVLARGFRWSSAVADAAQLTPTVQRLADEVPATIVLSYDDFLHLVADALAGASGAELGGRGAGVQVLDVTAARGRTFSRLFVMGLNRDVFPRMIVEDPLVPDSVRRAITTVLPDFPIKQLGFDEERYLFAQLVSASPHVTLSWQYVSDDGSALSPSPLVERLRLTHRELAVETVPSLYSPPVTENSFIHIASPLRPAHEWAVLTGLYGAHDDVAPALAIALRKAPQPGSPPAISADEAGRIQLAIIDEHDGRSATGRFDLVLGPYYGFIGAASESDPRQQRLFITTVEGVARCPWRTFIGRLLGVQPLPDALESLPAVSARLLGDIVHRVLDRIISDAVGHRATALDPSAAPRSVPVAWPPPTVLDRILEEEATWLVEECGLALPGLVPLMVRHTRAYVVQAARHDWPHAGATVSVIGSEINGVVQVNDPLRRCREVHFKADRVDATGAGLRLTDYKTGRPMDGALVANVANGTHLQCMAYALGAGRPDAAGRYLYLKPDIENARRDVVVPADAADLVAAFHSAVRTVLDVWDTGAFFPRFAEPNGTEFGDCRFCEVREACFRNEADYRARLLRWVATAEQRIVRTSLPPALRALCDVWALRAKAEASTDAIEENA